MEVGLWDGLALGVLVVLGLREVMVAGVLLKLGLRPARPRSLAEGEIPASLREALEVAARWLEPHGFRPLGFMEGYDISAPPGTELPPALVLVDAHGTFAHVSFQLPCDPASPFHIWFATEFSDDTALVTANAQEHLWLGDPPRRTSQHVWCVHFVEQLEKHRSAIAGRVGRAEACTEMSLDAFITKLSERSNDLIARLTEEHVVTYDESTGASHLGLLAAFPRGRRLMQGMARAARLRKERLAAIQAGTLQALDRVPVEVEIASADVVQRIQEAQLPKRAGKILFVASVALSLVGALIWLDAQVVLALFITLLIHEGGHYLAMRLYGHSDAKVFFVPMIGAVTVARPRPTSTTQEVMILLAGPVPGLLLALVLGLWPIAALGSFGHVLTFWLAALNFFNLLPVMPLDGGKVFERVVLGKSPYAGFVFSVFSVLALALLSVLTGDGMLLGFLALLVLGWPRQWRTARLKRLLGAQLSGPVSRDRLVQAFTLLSQDKRLPARDKLGVIRSLAPHWGRVHARWPVRVAWGSGYVACLLGSAAMLPFVLGAAPGSGYDDSKAQPVTCDDPALSVPEGGDAVFICDASSTTPALAEELRAFNSLSGDVPCLRAPWHYPPSERAQRQREFELRTWLARKLSADDSETVSKPASQTSPLPADLDEAQRALLESATNESLTRPDVQRALATLLGSSDSCQPKLEEDLEPALAVITQEAKLRIFVAGASDLELNEMAALLCGEGLQACSFLAYGPAGESVSAP